MILKDSERLCVFTGNANPELAQEIAEQLGVKMGKMFVGQFNNGETQVIIDESVRGKEIFLIQPTSNPANEHVMELLIMVDAFRRASARHIIAVIPYYAYARQDRKTRGREPISAKLMANLLTTAGVSRVITMDLHAGQIQGFFDIPVDHMSATPILSDYIASKNLPDLVVVSPDLGGVTRARQLADRLGAPIAIIEKKRPAPGVAEVMNTIGSVEGKTAVIVDDIVDTAGSLVEGAKALERLGAKEVYACCSHPVLSDPAVERIEKSNIKELIVTNSIQLPLEKRSSKIKILSIAKLLSGVIANIHNEVPVSQLFD